MDNFGVDPRFKVVYELYQFERGDSLRLKVTVSEDDLELDTVCDIWPTADWHEREAYDMFGLALPRPPGPAPHLHVGRLPVLPAAQGFPARRPAPPNCPDVGFTRTAPMEGGPFVTVPTTRSRPKTASRAPGRSSKGAE